jgi:ubiquitin carboxyl-terminal hydrolase 34
MIDIGLKESPGSLRISYLQKLICSCFAVLLDGSVRDQGIWNAVKEKANFNELIFSLLLVQSRKIIRIEVLERIKIICGPLKPSKLPGTIAEETGNSTENPLRIDILATLWNSLVDVIAKTPMYARQSEEFFIAALWMFRTIAEKSPCDLIFNDYLKQWSSFMFSHRTEEFIGREPVDNLIVGFSSLLEWCLKLAIAANFHLETLDIAEQILQNYLFPDFSPDSKERQHARAPVMNANTRQSLYNVVSLLCKQSDQTYSRVLEILEPIVPRDVIHFDWAFDRSAMIRSPEGYAGLRNLSNTCYLNSLMTQLFMNVEFRDFVLKLHVADPESQKLLFETQKLFTWMQETWRKSIEPQDFVDSIRTYDNELIDVTIQMDVDEFYNLLFDRWESQVLEAESKKKFRSFYGGQLVQQIKSMECPHISERLEPFSAIQCEIKGKAGLEDSLRAYVAGEVMQGDNKYFCTSCDNHVNAVKRACLKDVPDNLIFHLKRFDFDMVTMLRSKINDEFTFPRHIDMTPYTVEHLADPDQPTNSDYFELTGVLVHTGTAESGHYYSYTLERPSPDGEPSWVEFNDSDVSRFDPSSIADHCFGGPSEQMQYNGEPKNKVWNAYMLFYQRVSTMEKSKSVYKPARPDVPVHVPVSVPISNHIAMDNEVLIRTYCLLDPHYAVFVEGLLQRWSGMPDDNPNKKLAETRAINIGMDSFEQMVSRTKDLQGLQELFTILLAMINKSPNAASSSLDWLFDRETPIRNLMTKMHQPEVRHKQILLIIFAVKHLHNLSKDPTLEDSEQAFWRNKLEEAIIRLASMLIELWPSIQGISRVWEDYFGFFVKLCNYGSWVVELLADKQLFTVCMQILWLDEDDRKRMRVHLPNYSRLLDKGRRFSYLNMLSLFHIFLKHADLSLDPVGPHDSRTISNGKFSLRLNEMELIKPIERDGSLGILRQILKHDALAKNQTAHLIIATLLSGEPAAGFLPSIQKTIENGLRIEPAIQCAPFLEAAVFFCQNCPSKQRIIDMITYVATGVDSIDSSGGQEHIAFFLSLCQTSNERINLNADALAQIVFTMLPTWAPTLLIDRNESVRQSMHSILGAWVFQDRNEDARSESSEETGEADHSPESDNSIQKRRPVIGRALVRASIDRLKASFVKDPPRHVDGRQVEIIISVMKYCLDKYFTGSEEDQQTLTEAKSMFKCCCFILAPQ